MSNVLTRFFSKVFKGGLQASPEELEEARSEAERIGREHVQYIVNDGYWIGVEKELTEQRSQYTSRFLLLAPVEEENEGENGEGLFIDPENFRPDYEQCVAAWSQADVPYWYMRKVVKEAVDSGLNTPPSNFKAATLVEWLATRRMLPNPSEV